MWTACIDRELDINISNYEIKGKRSKICKVW